MGTRAQFFVGNPSDIETRKFLGTVAFDGYPDGDCGDALMGVKDAETFEACVRHIASKRDDFADPAVRSFPFPWKDDLYLTDCTYAFFHGAVQFTAFHTGFVPLEKYRAFTEAESEAYFETEVLPSDVPAPSGDLPKGPDSIMIFSGPRT